MLKKKLYHDVQEMLKRNETAAAANCHRIFSTLDGELVNHGDEEEVEDEVVRLSLGECRPSYNVRGNR